MTPSPNLTPTSARPGRPAATTAPVSSQRPFAAGGVALAVGLALAGPVAFTWTQLALDDPDYSPWRFLMHPATMLQLLGLAALALVAYRVAAAMLASAGPARRNWHTLVLDQEGALTVEFVLCFPFILALVFIFFQWVELLMVEALVHYATFAACRAAAVLGSAAIQPNERFRLIGEKLTRMQRAAEVAIHPAKAMEGSKSGARQPFKVEFVPGSGGSPDIQSNDHADGGGAYKFVELRGSWAFFPRWPMAQLFFRPLCTEGGRIGVTTTYAMQCDGYFRSYTLNPDSKANKDGDRYKSDTQMEDTKKREGVTQKALYQEVLKESHGAQNTTSGSKDTHKQCKDR